MLTFMGPLELPWTGKKWLLLWLKTDPTGLDLLLSPAPECVLASIASALQTARRTLPKRSGSCARAESDL